MPQSYINDAGTWKPWTPWGKTSGGVWAQAKRAFVNDQGVWKKFYQREVVVTLSNANSIVLKGYFNSSDWDDPLILKRVVVPNGVTIGSTNST